MNSNNSQKLKKFIEKKAKKASREFQISLNKTETVKCDDCKKEIFVKGAFSGCICLGADWNNKIFIKKNETGFTIKFPRSWDIENIQMLLETLRNKNRGSV
jgi:DNA-directed RNA polymerase subunit RPC12/RpoP